MSKLRKFQVSEKYLWGFSTLIDLNEVSSIEEIINITLGECRKFLKNNNLLGLVDHLDIIKKEFHIHGNDLNSILATKPDEIIYVCCH